MKFLKHIWEDVERGENIDLYATVLVTFLLVILNLVGLAPASWMTSLTLTVLGLLAISNLGTRLHIKEMTDTLTRSASTVFLEEYPSEILNLIKSSSEIWFVGVTRNRDIKNYFYILESKLQRGDNVKVLIVNPDSPAIEAVRGRGRFIISREQMINNINDTLIELSYLKSIFPENIEVRTISYPVSYGAILINPNDSELTSGMIFMEHYPYRIKRTHAPKFVLTAKQDAEWFNLYKSEIYAMWNDSREWIFCDTEALKPEFAHIDASLQNDT